VADPGKRERMGKAVEGKGDTAKEAEGRKDTVGLSDQSRISKKP